MHVILWNLMHSPDWLSNLKHLLLICLIFNSLYAWMRIIIFCANKINCCSIIFYEKYLVNCSNKKHKPFIHLCNSWSPCICSSVKLDNSGDGRKRFALSSLNVWWCFQAITSKGGIFLEAPVSGSKKPAEDGQLVILAAGEKVRAICIIICYNSLV